MTSVNKSYWSQPILATVKTIVEIRSACIVVYMCSWISSLFHCPYLWVRGYPLMVGLQEVPQSLHEHWPDPLAWKPGVTGFRIFSYSPGVHIDPLVPREWFMNLPCSQKDPYCCISELLQVRWHCLNFELFFSYSSAENNRLWLTMTDIIIAQPLKYRAWPNSR